jgi:hypothetical protein
MCEQASQASDHQVKSSFGSFKIVHRINYSLSALARTVKLSPATPGATTARGLPRARMMGVDAAGLSLFAACALTATHMATGLPRWLVPSSIPSRVAVSVVSATVFVSLSGSAAAFCALWLASVLLLIPCSLPTVRASATSKACPNPPSKGASGDKRAPLAAAQTLTAGPQRRPMRVERGRVVQPSASQNPQSDSDSELSGAEDGAVAHGRQISDGLGGGGEADATPSRARPPSSGHLRLRSSGIGGGGEVTPSGWRRPPSLRTSVLQQPEHLAMAMVTSSSSTPSGVGGSSKGQSEESRNHIGEGGGGDHCASDADSPSGGAPQGEGGEP